MTLGSTARIASRSLWRSRRRTALALAAIGLSVMLVLVYDSILRAYGDWMVETVTGPMLGHVQVHAPEWRSDRGMDRVLDGVSAMIEKIGRDPDVASAGARVYAPALAALGEEGFAVLVMGVDAIVEARPMRLLSGASVIPGDRRVLMGRALAELMGVREGDEVAIVGQGADGSLANDLVVVAGLVDTPVDFVNRQGIVMSLEDAQVLFAMSDAAHEIVVHLGNARRARTVSARLGHLPALAGAEVLDWERLAPEMVSLVSLVRAAGLVALVLVFLAAAAGVANTMLMATFERTHEFGMLLALGVSPGRIVRLIVAESLALGAAGAGAGAAAGLVLVAITHRTGIDYAALTGTGPDAISFAGLRWSMIFYPTLGAADVLAATGAAVVTALVASVWPAARAARLEPARALRE